MILKDKFNILSNAQKLMVTVITFVVIIALVWGGIFARDYFRDKRVLNEYEEKVQVKQKEVIDDEKTDIKKEFSTDNPSIDNRVKQLLADKNKSESRVAGGDTTSAERTTSDTGVDVQDSLLDTEVNREEIDGSELYRRIEFITDGMGCSQMALNLWKSNYPDVIFTCVSDENDKGIRFRELK